MCFLSSIYLLKQHKMKTLGKFVFLAGSQRFAFHWIPFYPTSPYYPNDIQWGVSIAMGASQNGFGEYVVENPMIH